MRGFLFAVIVVVGCGGGSGGSADAPPAAVDAPAGGDTWTSWASTFPQTYCAECHGPGDALRDLTQLAMVRAEMDKIRCGVSPVALDGCTIPAGQFPVGDGPFPSDPERTRFVEWIDAGAPE